MLILKAISRLLSYPDKALLFHANELAAVLGHATELAPAQRQKLLVFFNELRAGELMDLQERYSALFDHGRSLSLLLFEHVHGESRDRGQAMVDLMAVYQRHGFEITVRELPDHIPLFLEYLSQRPIEEVREWLGEVGHILAMLSARLRQRDSSYHHLFDALLALSGAAVDVDALSELAAGEERDDTMAAFDQVWEEESVRFGAAAGAGACSPTPTRPAATSAQPLHWVASNSAGAAAPAAQ